MPFDNKEAVARILSDAAPGFDDDLSRWKQEAGIFAKSIRFDLSLSDTERLIHTVRYIAKELPLIADRIERETTPNERRIMAQSQLQWLRGRVGRGRR